MLNWNCNIELLNRVREKQKQIKKRNDKIIHFNSKSYELINCMLIF